MQPLSELLPKITSIMISNHVSNTVYLIQLNPDEFPPENNTKGPVYGFRGELIYVWGDFFRNVDFNKPLKHITDTVSVMVMPGRTKVPSPKRNRQMEYVRHFSPEVSDIERDKHRWTYDIYLYCTVRNAIRGVASPLQTLRRHHYLEAVCMDAISGIQGSIELVTDQVICGRKLGEVSPQT